MKKLLSVFVLLFGLTQVYGDATPSTPTGLNSPDATDSSITLTWDNSAWATGYKVYSLPEGGLAKVLVKDISGVSNTTIDITEIPNAFGTPISLKPARAYRFTVTAYNGDGESDDSTSVLAKTTHTWDGELLNCLEGSTSTPPTRSELAAITSFTCQDKNLTTMAPIEDLSQNITYLDLYKNDIAGTIPSWITTRTNLTHLHLWSNILTGSIPADIGNLVELTSLRLNHNDLTGGIPAEIGNLVKLTSLRLNHNDLTGSIPTEIENLVELVYLDLSYNELTENIPTEIRNLVELKNLYLSHNDLTGSIPAEIENLVELTSLFLSFNKLTGNIPTEIENLLKLTSLYLSSNYLTGVIPTGIENIPDIETLSLYDNCNLYTDEASLQAFIDSTPSENDHDYQYILDTNSHDCSTANPAVIMYLLN